MSDDPKPEPPQDEAPSWQYKTEFGINTRLREVIKMTIEASTLEVEALKRKLDKLTYGS